MYDEISKPAKINALPPLLNFVDNSSTKLALAINIRHKLLIVVEELFTNTIKHGGCSAQQGKVLLCLGRYQDCLHLQYQDQGLAFNPFTDSSVALSNRAINEGGVGIQLINRFMDTCHYKRALERNYLQMRKNL